MDIPNAIWNFLLQNSWATAILVFLFGIAYWVITHPESARELAKNIHNFADWLKERFFKRFALKVKATQDQRTINKVIDNINKQTHSKIPKSRLHYGLSHCSSRSYATRPNGVVNVYVKDTGDSNLNLLDAASAYLKTAVMPNLRSLMENIAAAIDLIVIMRILRKKNKKGLCGNFWGERFVQEASNPEVHEYVDNFLSMEKKGIFAGIALSEIEYADDNAFYRAIAAGETGLLKDELVDFVAFTTSISERAQGENTRLDFNRKYIKVGVLLVGGILTRLYGVQPYLARLTKSIQQGVTRVYVIAVGDDNVELTREIAMHNVKGAAMVRDLKVFHPEIFDFKPTIASLLMIAWANSR